VRDTADLSREGDRWKINGKYWAMQPKIDVLLETIQKLIVHGPASNLQRESVLKEFENGATKVQMFFSGEDHPFKTYYVDGSTEDSKGTYMMMEIDGKKTDKPYIMILPGFDGILNVRYFTDETEWRDTRIFNYAPEDIKQITVRYPEMPERSFTINVINADSFEVHSISSATSPKPADRIYKEGVVKYLSSFKSLNAEAFDNHYSKRDSIINSIPYVSITITDITSSVNQLVVFHMPLNKRSKLQFDEHGNRLPYDLDRYYATINGGSDFVIIQDFVFGKIFKQTSDFHVKDKSQITSL